MIKLFEDWNNDRKTNSIWRNTSSEFLYELLKTNKVHSFRSFISLSLEEDSGGMDNYGDVRIEFSKDEILKQGGIEIKYDIDFFAENPDIALHVSGYKDEQSYYDDKGYDNAEEAIADQELDWETYIEDFSNEQEVIIKEIKFNKDLILSVSGNIDEKTLELIKLKNIKLGN